MSKENVVYTSRCPVEGKRRQRPSYFSPETKWTLTLTGIVILIAADIMAFIRALEMAMW